MSANQEESVTISHINALKGCITAKMLTYKDKGSKNKRGAVSAQIILIVCSVLTPILIGWKPGPALLLNLALISSAVTTACSSLQIFFDWKELWTSYKVATRELENIIAEIDYYASLGCEKMTQKDIQDFFERYKSVCTKMDEEYKKFRTDKDEPTNINKPIV